MLQICRHRWCACRRGALLLVSKRWLHVYLAKPDAWTDLTANGDTPADMARLLQRAQRTGRLCVAAFLQGGWVEQAAAAAAMAPQLAQALRCLRPERLEALLMGGLPLVEPVASEVHRLAPLLGELALQGPASPPPDAAALVGQLTALRMLDLSIWRNISPEVLAAISRLPWLTELYLWSEAPLPDPATLTALEGLTRLELKEERSEHGLCVLSAACFPRLAQLAYSAENMMVSQRRTF